VWWLKRNGSSVPTASQTLVRLPPGRGPPHPWARWKSQNTKPTARGRVSPTNQNANRRKTNRIMRNTPQLQVNAPPFAAAVSAASGGASAGAFETEAQVAPIRRLFGAPPGPPGPRASEYVPGDTGGGPGTPRDGRQPWVCGVPSGTTGAGGIQGPRIVFASRFSLVHSGAT
jgi:hypothetical protein